MHPYAQEAEKFANRKPVLFVRCCDGTEPMLARVLIH